MLVRFKALGMTMSGAVFTDAMRPHLAPGHDDTGKATVIDLLHSLSRRPRDV
jgi:hypothetical protein